MFLNRILAAGCAAAALALYPGLAVPASGASTPTAPVIHESFTLQRCPRKPTTTLQIEGCAEHQVIALDQTINALNTRVFTKLGQAARRDFIDTTADWQKYRDALCATEASTYSDGSIGPIVYATCLVSIDRSHVNELKGMLSALSPAR